MTRRLAATARWAGRRLATVGLYVMAIIGASSWDRDPASWFLFVRLGGTAIWLYWAVSRTVTHWHEDQEDA